METLEQLIEQRNTFLQWGAEVPQALAEQISKLELQASAEGLLGLLDGVVPESLETGEGRVAYVVEYTDGVLTRIGVADEGVFDRCILEKDIATTPAPIERKKAKSVPFEVEFADGTKIFHTNAVRTMVEALQHMGLARAAEFTGKKISGFNLVDTCKRDNFNKHKFQHFVDGWYVYVHMSNDVKISCLKAVSEFLDMPLEIRLRPDEA